jgi:hypothetical protein
MKCMVGHIHLDILIFGIFFLLVMSYGGLLFIAFDSDYVHIYTN